MKGEGTGFSTSTLAPYLWMFTVLPSINVIGGYESVELGPVKEHPNYFVRRSVPSRKYGCVRKCVRVRTTIEQSNSGRDGQ